jgi:hypothetical protein
MLSLFSRPAFLRSAAAAALLISATLTLNARQAKDLLSPTSPGSHASRST